MPVYACDSASRVRSIAFSDDDICGTLATMHRQVYFVFSGDLPLANTLDLSMRSTLGLRFDAHGTCSRAGLPEIAIDGCRRGILCHHSRVYTIRGWRRPFHYSNFCRFPSTGFRGTKNADKIRRKTKMKAFSVAGNGQYLLSDGNEGESGSEDNFDHRCRSSDSADSTNHSRHPLRGSQILYSCETLPHDIFICAVLTFAIHYMQRDTCVPHLLRAGRAIHHP